MTPRLGFREAPAYIASLIIAQALLVPAQAWSPNTAVAKDYLFGDVPNCQEFRNQTSSAAKCSFIQQYCDEDGLWKPLETYYCSAVPNGMGVVLILLSTFWLYFLFQALASTADNFFSPILTQLSQDLGLPPRFAGVTFLALGNGAPDVSSTILAIKSGDYNLSLGALTGAGMFVGTVVAGACIITANGAKCRGALIRDVLGYAVTILLMLCVLADGRVSYMEVVLLLCLYLCFVMSVLGADLWHRLVHLKKHHPPQLLCHPAQQDMEMADGSGGPNAHRTGAAAGQAEAMIDYAHMPASRYRDLAWATLSKSVSFFKRAPSLKRLREQLFHAGALSSSFMHTESGNLCAGSSNLQWSDSAVESIAEDALEEGQHPELLQQRLLQGEASDTSDDEWNSNFAQGEYTATQISGRDGAWEPHGTLNLAGSPHGRSSGQGSASSGHSLTSMRPAPDRQMPHGGLVWADFINQSVLDGEATTWRRSPNLASNFLEPLQHLIMDLWNGLFIESWEEIQDMGTFGKLNMMMLLPVTLAQRATVPIIVSENYCQGWLVISIAICPVWMMYSLGLFGSSITTWICVILASVVAAGTAGFNSSRDVPPEWSCGSPILLGAALMCTFGFVVAASWIAAIADELVAMLQFFGYLSGVDSAVLGLTVLAWGNSVGDLSTNVSMAKRGLSNMALTACFAGPLFNMLVGSALGFMLWLRDSKTSTAPVALNTTVMIGGLFILMNCVSLVTIGIFHGRKIPGSTGYWMFALYGLYLAISIFLLFARGYEADEGS